MCVKDLSKTSGKVSLKFPEGYISVTIKFVGESLGSILESCDPQGTFRECSQKVSCFMEIYLMFLGWFFEEYCEQSLEESRSLKV